MQFIAPAKVNLSLNILGKRADGYHALSSCVGFADIGDVITLSVADDISITVTGEFASDTGTDEANLCVLAAQALQEALGVPQGVHIALEKHVPVGAGLGGGSSDAAAILNHLPAFWGAECPNETRLDIAKTLGADVPVCLSPQGLWLMEGIGHDCTALALTPNNMAIVLVHPRAATATAAVYTAFATLGAPSAPETVPEWQAMEQPWLWQGLAMAKNDLQLAAVSVTRQIAEVMQELAHALPEPELARMSGSGACCYALYKEKSQADHLASSLMQQHPNWWVQSTILR